MSADRTHEASDPTRDGHLRRGPDRADGRDAEVSAAAATESVSRLSPAGLLRLQRSAGSRAVSRALGAERLAVQRHAEGTALPTEQEDAAEVSEKLTTPIVSGEAASGGGTGGSETGAATETATQTPAPEEAPPQPTTSNTAPPAASRTKKEEKTEKAAGKKAGKQFQKNQKLTPGAMSLAAAQEVLQGVFGGVKKIVPGSVVILDNQPACAAKYDDLCIAEGIKRPDGSDWKKGDCAKDDAAAGVLTQGFAWKGVVYVNGETTLVTATTHEILHNNTADGFRAKVGETLNEGTTEYLARKALKASGVKVPSVTAYPAQVELAQLLIDFVGENTVINAYFGGPDSLVAAFEAKSATTWDQLKTDADALDKPKVKAALKKKKKK